MSVSITNVLLLDNVNPVAKDILENNGIKATISKDKYDTKQLITVLQDYDGVVIRSATKLKDDVLSQCPKLKIIGRAGTGVDNIDCKAASKYGIIVMNTPGGNTVSAAEHTCTLICCMARQVPAADASMKSGKWDRKGFMGHELYGKTLGIVGLGRIGREVATRMQSFGMTTLGFDPMVSKESAAESNIEWMSLDDMWPKVDYITVHTPLIPQTKGLLNDVSLGKCKPGVRVVNCARGGIIDEEALLRALESGQCGGAGLDVFEVEPPTNTALVNHPKVIACPHLGASTKEAQGRCGSEIAEQFVSVMKGESFFGVLNAPALSSTTSDEMRGWAATAQHLGNIVKNFMSGKSVEVSLQTKGSVLSKAGLCLKAAVCAGMLPSANLVNSLSLATDAGVEVSHSHENNDGAASLVISAKTGGDSLSLQGSMVQSVPSLTHVNSQQLSVPLPLSGNMSVFNGCDVQAALNAVGGKVTALSTTSGGIIVLATPTPVTNSPVTIGNCISVSF